MCYTRKGIFLSILGKGTVNDAIPMFEILEIIQMNSFRNSFRNNQTSDIAKQLDINSDAGESDIDDRSVMDTDKISSWNQQDGFRKFVNAFQIKTIPNGFTSGRTYALKAYTSSQFGAIVSDLERLSAEARAEAEAKSNFRRSQDRVRSIYNSTPFQILVAMLIVLVRIFHKA